MKTLLVWLLMVFALSVMPVRMPHPHIAHADKVLHLIIYAVTAALIHVLLLGRQGFFGRWAAPLAVVLATGYGVLMEIAQVRLASRDMSIEDMAANTVGAAVGAVFVLWRTSRKAKR
jgi:VanZ family protein